MKIPYGGGYLQVDREKDYVWLVQRGPKGGYVNTLMLARDKALQLAKALTEEASK